MGAVNKLKEFLLKDHSKEKPKPALAKGQNEITKKLNRYQQILQNAESGK